MTRRLAVLLGALTLFLTIALPAQSRAEGERRAIEAAGVRREYLLHLPASRRRDRPLPLLLVFHGAGGTAASMAEHAGLAPVATARGYAVVHPQGVNRRWNDGRGVSSAGDVAFIRTLLDSLSRELSVDPRRIYATGISNGAGIAFRLACELPGRFAAIATVAGGLASTIEPRCAAAVPVSLVMFQGTADRLIPYDGGDVALRRGRVLPTEGTAALFARLAGCDAAPTVTAEPDTVTDGTRVRRSTWSGCRDGREVALFTIVGGGHTWPGGPRVGRLVGRVSRDIDATRAMLDFVDRHPPP